MIRLGPQRRLTIPRGDTGSFSVPVQIDSQKATLFRFSIFNNGKVILSQDIAVENNNLIINFTHEDTKNLPLGHYYWDIKAYVNPVFNTENTKLVSVDEVHSYYAAYKLPECEITLATKYY